MTDPSSGDLQFSLQHLDPTADRHDYFAEMIDADGTRAAFVVQIGGGLAATTWSQGAPLSEHAEQLARELRVCGARDGEFRFIGNNAGQSVEETLATIRAEGPEFFRPPATTQRSPF